MVTTWQPQERTALQRQLVDVMNHELRTPLPTLLGHAEILQELERPREARASVTSIVRAGERLRDLAVKVTAATDAHGHVERVVPGHCDLAALGRAVVSEQVARAAARGLTFRMSRSGPHAVAFADEKLVREAVAALVAHAVEHASAASADAASADAAPSDEAEPSAAGAASAGTVVEVAVDVHEDIAALNVRISDSEGRFPKAPAMVPFAHLTVPVPRSGDDVVGLVLADAVAAAHGGFLLVSAEDDAMRCLRLELPRGLRLAA
jgi:signal transduction histidine kinase